MAPTSMKSVHPTLAHQATASPASDTIRDTDVPHFFREQHILSGYRRLHQDWSYYFLSLLRCHNETVNVWTHLLGTLLVLKQAVDFAGSVDFIGDRHSWPLLILLLSSMSYMGFSAVTHLLAGKSEVSHYAFCFLDYVGVALYQYGSALAHYYYAIEESWHGRVRGVFMPVASLLCCLSCFGCCYGKYRNYSLPLWARKAGQVAPSAVAYLWDSSPVFHRIALGVSAWARGDATNPVVVFHAGQVGFFLSSVFFFTHPVPESWFPGRCDILGQAHQIFHVLLVLCTLCQVKASHLDFLERRELYARLHGAGEAEAYVVLFALTLLACCLIAVVMLEKVKRLLGIKDKQR